MRNSHHGRRHYHCQDKVIPELAGAIFMCNNDTRKECFSRRIFGLPACRERFVRRVTDSMFLFLFDTDNRKMYGVFKATSNGAMNIVPQAFTSTGTTYPAQVPFGIIRKCKPLTEREFKPAILEKYFTDVKFNFDLNFDQVQRLLVLFEEKKVRGVPQSITDRWHPSSSTDSPLKRYDGMSNTNTLSQTIHSHVRNPNPSAEVAMHFMNSDMNLHHQIDADVVNPDDQQVTLSAYNHQDLSSPQAVQLYDPDPPFPENIEMTVGACSDFYSGSLLNSESQLEDVKRRKSVFLRLARNPQRTARETDPCQIGVYTTKNQPGHDSRVAKLPRPVYNKQVVQGQEPVHTARSVAVDGIGIELGSTAPVETQIRIVKNIKRRNGGSKLSIELKGDKKKRRLVRAQSMNSNTDTEEEGSDLDVVDTMEEEVIPTAPVSNLTVRPDETQIPFVNFNWRNGGNRLIIEPNKGDKKKMGLIKPSSVNTASALDEESMVITDTMDVDAQTEVELVDTPLEGFQGNHKGEKVLEIANFSEGQLELPVLCEKTDEKKSVSNPEPTDTESIIEIKDNSLCLHNEKSNLVEDYIALEPEKLEMDVFWFYQKSKAVEDYIALESHDENSRETFEYIEIADQDYIPLE